MRKFTAAIVIFCVLIVCGLIWKQKWFSPLLSQLNRSVRPERSMVFGSMEVREGILYVKNVSELPSPPENSDVGIGTSSFPQEDRRENGLSDTMSELLTTPPERGTLTISRSPPRRLLLSSPQLVPERNGWVLLGAFPRKDWPKTRPMSAQQFSDGKLDGFSLFFGYDQNLAAAGVWKLGLPYDGFFPVQLQKNRLVLVTDGYWNSPTETSLIKLAVFRRGHFLKYTVVSAVHVDEMREKYPNLDKLVLEALNSGHAELLSSTVRETEIDPVVDN
jgi:hypothetical protein